MRHYATPAVLAWLAVAVVAEPCQGGQREPLSGGCTGYRTCVHGEWTEATCPTPWVFHPSRLTCVGREEYQCRTRTSCYPDGIIRPDGDCSRYEVCMDGYWTPHQCSEGYTFDTSAYICSQGTGCLGCDKDSPDPGDCGGYFTCLGSGRARRHCGRSQIFDAVDGRCVNIMPWQKCYSDSGALATADQSTKASEKTLQTADRLENTSTADKAAHNAPTESGYVSSFIENTSEPSPIVTTLLPLTTETSLSSESEVLPRSPDTETPAPINNTSESESLYTETSSVSQSFEITRIPETKETTQSNLTSDTFLPQTTTRSTENKYTSSLPVTPAVAKTTPLTNDTKKVSSTMETNSPEIEEITSSPDFSTETNEITFSHSYTETSQVATATETKESFDTHSTQSVEMSFANETAPYQATEVTQSSLRSKTSSRQTVEAATDDTPSDTITVPQYKESTPINEMTSTFSIFETASTQTSEITSSPSTLSAYDSPSSIASTEVFGTPFATKATETKITATPLSTQPTETTISPSTNEASTISNNETLSATSETDISSAHVTKASATHTTIETSQSLTTIYSTRIIDSTDKTLITSQNVETTTSGASVSPQSAEKSQAPFTTEALKVSSISAMPSLPSSSGATTALSNTEITVSTISTETIYSQDNETTPLVSETTVAFATDLTTPAIEGTSSSTFSNKMPRLETTKISLPPLTTEIEYSSPTPEIPSSQNALTEISLHTTFLSTTQYDTLETSSPVTEKSTPISALTPASTLSDEITAASPSLKTATKSSVTTNATTTYVLSTTHKMASDIDVTWPSVRHTNDPITPISETKPIVETFPSETEIPSTTFTATSSHTRTETVIQPSELTTVQTTTTTEETFLSSITRSSTARILTSSTAETSAIDHTTDPTMATPTANAPPSVLPIPCRKGKRLPNVYYCKKFYECNKRRVWVSKTCSWFTYFDTDSEMCLLWNARCAQPQQRK